MNERFVAVSTVTTFTQQQFRLQL